MERRNPIHFDISILGLKNTTHICHKQQHDIHVGGFSSNICDTSVPVLINFNRLEISTFTKQSMVHWWLLYIYTLIWQCCAVCLVWVPVRGDSVSRSVDCKWYDYLLENLFLKLKSIKNSFFNILMSNPTSSVAVLRYARPRNTSSNLKETHCREQSIILYSGYWTRFTRKINLLRFV